MVSKLYRWLLSILDQQDEAAAFVSQTLPVEVYYVFEGNRLVHR